MNSLRSPWFRLAAVARLAPADGLDASAPQGFATRVAALAFSRRGESSIAALVTRFSWRALAVAALVMAVSIAANYEPLVTSLSQHQDVTASVSDPVGDWLDVT